MLKALKRLMAIMLVISLAFSFPIMFDQNAHATTTDFVTSKQDLDSILQKPYVDNVPTAFSEALFATHSKGWGFDSNTIFRSGIADGYGMPVTVKVNGITVEPQSGTYRPSSVESTFEKSATALEYRNVAPDATLSASHTSTYDQIEDLTDGIISYTATGQNRWSSWSQRGVTQYLQFDFSGDYVIDKIIIYPYDDIGGDNNVFLPKAVELQYYNGTEWVAIPNVTAPAALAQDTPAEYTFEQLTTSAVRVYLTPEDNKVVAVTELEIFGYGNAVTNIAQDASLSASYTCTWDSLDEINDGIVGYEPSAGNRWSTYNLKGETHYVQFDFATTYAVNKVVLYPYDDIGGDNNVHLPQKVELEYYNGSQWLAVPSVSGPDALAQDTPAIYKFPDVNANAIRVYVTPESDKVAGITELEIFGFSNDPTKTEKGVLVTENKFITTSDVATSVITFENKDAGDKTVEVSTDAVEIEREGMYTLLSGADFTLNENTLSKSVTLKPGEKATFVLALGFAYDKQTCADNLNAVLDDTNPLLTHKNSFLAWFEQNVPFFDSDNESLVATYYFRWLSYRNNIRKITYGDYKDNYIISEFLPNVSWAGAYNTINCAAAQHIYEGRWLRNGEYISDYQNFWFTDEADSTKYSFPMADAYFANYLVKGDKTALISLYNGIADQYADWEDGTDTSYYSKANGLYYQVDNLDGMEAGIGGSGLRPTINSYMYADSLALSRIAAMSGNTESAQTYLDKASALKTNIEQKLWNEDEKFFETVVDSTGKSVNVRELIGYIPWMYSIPEDDAKYADAWLQLTDTDGFLADYGPTTAEQRDEKFMATNNGTCRWDGPSWPFATAQTLTAAANYLNNYKNTGSYTVNEYWDMLMTYTKTHYKNGYSWIAEDLDPYTGKWIVDHPRSIHYNHSTYNDLIITGLAGIRPDDNDDILVVNPLVPDGELSYFIIENVSYRGHNITVSFDIDGTKYAQGLNVYVDGELAAHSDALAEVEVPLHDGVPAAPVGLATLTVADSTITVTEINGAEYSIDGGESWQTSNTFEKLISDTTYSIVARMQKTDSAPAGLMSAPLTVTTTAEHNYSYAYDDDNHWWNCSDCDDTQYVEPHKYDNICDTDCNDCGKTRAIEHSYDNTYDNVNHFDKCLVCGDTANATPHSFDGVNDTTCNGCDFTLAAPRFAASFTDPHNMIDAKKSVMLVSSADYTGYKQGEYVTVNWCGTDYTLKMGEDLFTSIADIEAKDFDNPHILVKAYPTESAFYLTKPASVFTQNYASNPVNKGTAPDGSDWSFNEGTGAGQFNTTLGYDIEVNNLGGIGDVPAGDYNFYGFTIRYHVVDWFKADYVNVRVENCRFLSKNWGDTTTHTWANTTPANTFMSVTNKESAGIDSITLKNIYLTTDSGDYAGTIFAGTMHEHVTYDGLLVDIPTESRVNASTNVVQQGADTSFVIKNSCFKNYALYNINFVGCQKAVSGQKTVVELSDNIFFNSELRGIYDGIVGYLPDNFTELTIKNNRIYAPYGCQIMSSTGSGSVNEAAPMKMTITGNFVDYSLYDYTSATDRNYSKDSSIADNYIELPDGQACERFKITGTAVTLEGTTWYLNPEMTNHSSTVYPVAFDGESFDITETINVESTVDSVDLLVRIDKGDNSAVKAYSDEECENEINISEVTVSAAGTKVYVKILSPDGLGSQLHTVVINKEKAFGITNTGLGATLDTSITDGNYYWVSWKGTVSSTGAQMTGEADHRVGAIYLSDTADLATMKEKIEASVKATKDVNSIETAVINANAEINSKTIKAYYFHADHTLTWNNESQSYGYRYNFNIKENYYRAVVMYVVYLDADNNIQVEFSDMVVQQAK